MARLVLLVALPILAAADDLASIVRDFDAHMRILDPVRAGQRGDRDALRRWPDNSPAAVAERKQRLLAFRDRLAAIGAAALSGTDALNHALLTDRVDVALAGFIFDKERIPFISGDGFYTTADYAALGTSLVSEDDAEAWLARLEALPAYYATETANMARGIRTGFTQPQMTVERAIGDVRAQAEQPARRVRCSRPSRRFRRASPPIGARSYALARSRHRVKVKPAQRELHRFLEQDYRPAARSSIGASSLPDGQKYTHTSCGGTRRRR